MDASDARGPRALLDDERSRTPPPVAPGQDPLAAEWQAAPAAEMTPSGSGRLRAAEMVPLASDRSGRNTGSTLRQAVGQSVPVESPPASRWKRALVIAATATVAAGTALGALLWPAAEPPSAISDEVAVGSTVAPAARPAVSGSQPAPSAIEVAKVRVILDVPAVVSVDGAAQPAAKETEVQVTAGAPHRIAVRVPAGGERNVLVPPLEPGEVRSVRLRLAQ
jgi:hypothetical protein